MTVTARNTGTGAERIQVTSATGDYMFTFLPIRTYSIRIELQGFKTHTAKLTLTSGDRARVDGSLEVGALSETVLVTGESPLLQTDASNVSSLVTEQALQELPIQERNIYRLVQFFRARTKAPRPSTGRALTRRQTHNVSVNGAGDAREQSPD